LVAKISSDQAKPNGVLYIAPGTEAAFLAPLEIRKVPGVGKKTEESLHKIGIRYVGDLAALDESFLAQRFGKWGLALAGKSQGLDAGGWFDTPIGANEDPKSISHEHTFNIDTAKREELETALLKLTEMVAARLREHKLYSRTVSLKLRDEDFVAVTELFRKAWDGQKPIRLLGVHAGGLQPMEGQMNLLEEEQTARMREVFRSVDHIRDKYGDAAISLAKTLKAGIRERVQDTPARRKK